MWQEQSLIKCLLYLGPSNTFWVRGSTQENWKHFHLLTHNTGKVISQGVGGGGGTLIFSYIRRLGSFFAVTLKCVKDSFSHKGLLFAKRTFIIAKRTFILAKTICQIMPSLILNIIKLKLNDINQSIYAVEIVFETLFHGNGRNSDLRKGVSLLRKGLCI